jgi:ribonuclease Z
VLTHFSQRYDDPAEFRDDAAAVFDGEIVVAEDLLTVPVPTRVHRERSADPAPR